MSEAIIYAITAAGLAISVSVGAALFAPARWRARISLTMLGAAAGLWAVSLALWLGV